MSDAPVSCDDSSEGVFKFFLGSAGLLAGLAAIPFDNKTPAVWFRCGLSGGRPGEELGVLKGVVTGVDDNELPLVAALGDEGNECSCSKFDGPLLQGWDKSCSRVGLSLGFIISIQDIRSLASIETKNTVNDLSKLSKRGDQPDDIGLWKFGVA